MQLVEYRVEPAARTRFIHDDYTGVGYVEQVSQLPDCIHVKVWFNQDELVHLFEPRSSADTLAYIVELAFLDRAFRIDCEYDVMRRGYVIAGMLDQRRGRIDPAIMAILPRGDVQSAPSSDVGGTPDTVQPVAKPARRLLHL